MPSSSACSASVTTSVVASSSLGIGSHLLVVDDVEVAREVLGLNQHLAE